MDFITSFLLNFIKVYQFAILIRVLLSWIQGSENNRFGAFVYQITEPFLGAIRKIMPNTGMIDLSPLIALLLLGLIQKSLSGGLI